MSTDVSLSECVVGTNVIACYGPRGVHRRKVYNCPTCERRTPHILKWDGAWYGTTSYCIACLDGWQDGCRMERPFRPRWKVDRAAKIKALWDTALMPAEWTRWTRLDVHRATCHDEFDACAECQGAVSDAS